MIAVTIKIINTLQKLFRLEWTNISSETLSCFTNAFIINYNWLENFSQLSITSKKQQGL